MYSKTLKKQEYIPEGCVPSATVAVCWGEGVPAPGGACTGGGRLLRGGAAPGVPAPGGCLLWGGACSEVLWGDACSQGVGGGGACSGGACSKGGCLLWGCLLPGVESARGWWYPSMH